MSDLIERADAMYVSNPTLPSCKLCKELADEIEHLQTRVEALEGVAQAVCDTKQICQFETRLQTMAREALAAREQGCVTESGHKKVECE